MLGSRWPPPMWGGGYTWNNWLRESSWYRRRRPKLQRGRLCHRQRWQDEQQRERHGPYTGPMRTPTQGNAPVGIAATASATTGVPRRLERANCSIAAGRSWLLWAVNNTTHRDSEPKAKGGAGLQAVTRLTAHTRSSSLPVASQTMAPAAGPR
jgi:hypothetical protein